MAPANWEKSADIVSIEAWPDGGVRFQGGPPATQSAWVELPGEVSTPVFGNKTTITFDFLLPPGMTEHQVGFAAGSNAMMGRAGWNRVGGNNRFQVGNAFPQTLVKAADFRDPVTWTWPDGETGSGWGPDLLDPTLPGVWYNMWVVYDGDNQEISFYTRRADSPDTAPIHRGTFDYIADDANPAEDLASLDNFVVGVGIMQGGQFAGMVPEEFREDNALGGVFANLHASIGPEPNLTLAPGAKQLDPPAWQVVDTFSGGEPSAEWQGDLEDMVLDFSEGYLDLRSDVTTSALTAPSLSRSIYVELPETVTFEAVPPIFTVTFDLNIKGPAGEANSFGFGVAGDDRIGQGGYARRGGDDHFGLFGGGAQNLVKRQDSAIILPSSARDEWYQVWLAYNAVFRTVDVYVAPDGEGPPTEPTQSYSLAHEHENFRYLVLGHDTSAHEGVKFGNIYFAHGDRLALSPTAGVFVPADDEPGEAPQITSQPSDMTVDDGGTATFAVAASGNPAPAYQWRVSTDGGSSFSDLLETSPYSGTSTDTLTISPAEMVLDGNLYQVVVSNDLDSVTSEAALLTVEAVQVAPTIVTQPSSVTVQEGGDAAFTSVATGDPEPTYQWEVSTDGGASFSALPEEAPYSGTMTTNLSITMVGTDLNGHQFRVVATNAAGEAVSGVATLTVQADPVDPVDPDPGQYEDEVLGHHYYFGQNWALWQGGDEQADLGIIHLGLRGEDGLGWVWHEDQGDWIYLVGVDIESGLFGMFARPGEDRLGWIYTRADFEGLYYSYDDEAFIHWVPDPDDD